MQTPKSIRPHIGIFGRRNTGKSSLMNMLTGYESAVVSPVPGTTTDPVEKSVEIPPLGPVVLIDTAGLDDEGELGELRVQRADAALAAVHLALLVSDGIWGEYEKKLSLRLTEKNIPYIVVWSKDDAVRPPAEAEAALAEQGVPRVLVSTSRPSCIADLTLALAGQLPEEAVRTPVMLRDLVAPGGVCLLVTPIDASAPKARLIAPQVQAVRDLLDGHSISLLVQPEELEAALNTLAHPPQLVVCDSQAVQECVRKTPQNIPLTTFSILMARMKADLPTLAGGAAAIHSLKDGDKVCISEVCAHHSQPDDIGRVKIPALLKKFTGAGLDIHFAAGRDFPAALSEYALIIHCGGCMVNRPTMLYRLAEAMRQGVPVTNYGVAISLMQNVLERSLQIFPDALAAYKATLGQR